MPIAQPATRPAARRALAAAASAPESLAIGEQGADCATVGVPPLKIGSFSLFVHANSRVLFDAPLFHPIVRRFFRDNDVVHVALAQSRGGDSHESALLAEFLKRRRSHVSHAAFETTDKLVRQWAQLAFIGHTALHALRNGFAALRAFLRVTVCGTCVHRARRTHASI